MRTVQATDLSSRVPRLRFIVLRFRSLGGSHESIGIGDWLFPRRRRGDCTEISSQGRRSPGAWEQKLEHRVSSRGADQTNRRTSCRSDHPSNFLMSTGAALMPSRISRSLVDGSIFGYPLGKNLEKIAAIGALEPLRIIIHLQLHGSVAMGTRIIHWCRAP